MSTTVVFNGISYQVPAQGDTRWGPYTSRYLTALGTYALAPSGGAFTLTADVNFGANFGLLSKYFTSITSTPATAGVLRLAKTDAVEWRNNAGAGNNVLSVDSSDHLLWNGTVIDNNLAALPDGQIWIGNGSSIPTPQTLTGDVTVTDLGVTAIGAGKIVNSQISNSAAIAYSKLSLTGSIVNADIFSSAAIATSKLAALSASIVPVTDASGFLTSSATTTTELGYVHGVTSAIQTQMDAKAPLNSPVLVTPNLGTPSAGVLTNCSGTAASLTAGHVTTNANLTGPITSSGNATSIASQTGTGTKFVVDTSPVLVTPTLGVAAATSINFGDTALANYKEGTWTPADASGASLSLTVTSAKYTRVGNVAHIQLHVTYPSTASGAAASISGLPFTVNGYGTAKIESNTGVTDMIASFRNATTTLTILKTGDAAVTNANLTTGFIIFTGFYLI